MRCALVMLTGLLALAFRPGIATSQPETAEATVVGIASIDIAAIWDAEVFREARETLTTKAKRFKASSEKEIGLRPEQIRRITMVHFKVITGEIETTEQATVITARQPIDVPAFVKATGAKRVVDKGKYEDLPEVTVYEAGNTRLALTANQVLVFEQRFAYEVEGDVTKTVKKPPAHEREMIAKSLKRDADRAEILAKDGSVLSVSLDVTEMVRLFQPQGGFGGEPEALPPALAPLAKARFLTASLSLKSKAEFKVELSFIDAEAAAAGKAALESISKQLSRLLDETVLHANGKPQTGTFAELAKLGMTLLDRATITAKDKTLAFTTAAELTKDLAGTLARGVLAAENAATRTISQNNLKQIALAAHNYLDAGTSSLLQNICDENGKALLSWRVTLLPYMEQEALFKEFKLTEPWDSEHNIKLIAKMPKIFAVPTGVAVKEGHTFYQTFRGKKGQAMRPLLQDGDEKGLSIQGILDGSSNTIMVAEAAVAVEWTKPDDIPFDSAGKIPTLGGHYENGFNVAFCDGSVRFLKSTILEATLKALITANGGENVSIDDE